MASNHNVGKGTREKRYWLDDPRNIDRIVWGLYGICAFLLLIDFFLHKHGPFAIEHLFGFYGIFGFVACVGLVLAAKWLRAIVMRRENYYDL